MSSGAFAGVRVADFSACGAGARVSKYLADHGAEVIKVETSRRVDPLRLTPPFAGDETGLDRSGHFANLNSSKLSISLDLEHPDGPAVARRLIAVCDAVIESSKPGMLAGLGLSFQELQKVRPDLVVLSLSPFGQTGPWSGYAGDGNALQGPAGISHLTGFSDGPPVGTGVAYVDILASQLAAIAVIAAMDHRRRTGAGQHIECSKVEATLHGLGTALLDLSANGTEQVRDGNRDTNAAPHGCYPTRDGKWIVLGCETEDHWVALKAAMGRPDWADLERMRRRHQRLNEQHEIDRHVGMWIEDSTRRPDEPEWLTSENPEQPPQRRYTNEELIEVLQGFGLPCGLVQSPEDLRNDRQLAHRDHFVMLEHPVMGSGAYDAHSFRLSGTPANLNAAPCLGADNEHVYRDIVGLSAAEFETLRSRGAFA